MTGTAAVHWKRWYGGMAAKTLPNAEFEDLVAQEVRSEGCADELVSHTL